MLILHLFAKIRSYKQWILSSYMAYLVVGAENKTYTLAFKKLKNATKFHKVRDFPDWLFFRVLNFFFENRKIRTSAFFAFFRNSKTAGFDDLLLFFAHAYHSTLNRGCGGRENTLKILILHLLMFSWSPIVHPCLQGSPKGRDFEKISVFGWGLWKKFGRRGENFSKSPEKYFFSSPRSTVND